MKAIIEHIVLVTRLLGAPVSEAALSAEVVRDKKLKVNYHSLVEVLRSHGFENTLSKRNLEDIPSLAVPVMIILHNEEAAVITQIEGSGQERKYHIRQVDGLEQELSHEQLSGLYLGYCWFIKPKMATDMRSELPEYHLPKAWFWKVIWRFRSYYYQVILATIIINFLALVSSLYVMNVYDRVIPNQAYETLWVLSIGVVLAILFEFAAKMIRGHLTDIAGKKADLIISSALFRRVMALRLADRPASSGSYASNLREFEAVREFMTSASLLTIVDLPFLLLFIFVISMVGGKLALVPLTIIPIVVIVGFVVQRPLSRHINESMKEGSQRSGLAVEAIEGIETLKTNNATSWAQQRWDEYTAKTSASSIKVKDTSNFMVNFAVAMQQLNTVFLVVVGTYLIHADNHAERITMGALIASVILSGRALAPLAQIAGLATRFQQAKLALKGVNDIVTRPIERNPERKYITLDNVQGSITFENVSFKYQADNNSAVEDLRLTIKPGEKIAIVGPSGAGKSTITSLLLRLYEPKEGCVCLDGKNIQDYTIASLRSQIAIVPQDNLLFGLSVRENIALGAVNQAEKITDEEIIQAAKLANAHDFITALPQGYDTILSERGGSLSGGQRQRIAIARVAMNKSAVLILDEPTVGLDQENEAHVISALENLMQNRTTLMITHDLALAAKTDRILFINNGTIEEQGNHQQLLAQGGNYANWWKLQLS